MEIILLSKIERLGNLGDVVTVKPGYARNYLIPSKKAKFATPENIAEFERYKAEAKRRAEAELTRAREMQSRLNGLLVDVPAHVSGGNKLFGSVGSDEIAKAVFQHCGEEIKRSEVYLPDGVLREVGTFPVVLTLHAGVDITIEVNIVPAK